MPARRPTLEGREALNLLGGGWVAGERYEVRDPGDLEVVVGHGHAADAGLVHAAVESAVAAAPGWAATTLEDRIGLLGVAQDPLLAGATDRSWPTLLTSEQGKVLAESTGEVGRAPGMVDLFAALARSALAPEDLTDERGRREVTHGPVGPVVAITPWNWPVALSLGKVLPALMAGNPVILKPAHNTPLAITEIVGTIADVLPPGVLNVVHGAGEVGAALVSHPGVRKVVFTGSTSNGKHVFASSAASLKNITLELGGNDPALVLDDADLGTEAIASMMASAFVTTGQVCWAIKRVYVHRSRFDELCERLGDALDQAVVGHGLDPASTLGPLNNEVQLQKITALAEDAERAGAKVIRFGAAAYEPDQGHYCRPALVTGIDEQHELVQTEQFGPLLPLLPFDEVDHAVAAANGTPYGLCASVWSSDPERAFDVARRLEAGQVFVNVHAGRALDYSQGIGGVRESGLGREYGIEGVRQYTEQRVLSDRILR